MVSLTKGNKFKKYLPKVFYLEEDKAIYEWQMEELLKYVFREALNNIAASYLMVGDDSMSEISFWTTNKGNLPHLYYIFLKP